MKKLNKKPHIEDEIFRIKNFLSELTKVQTAYFEKLAKDYNFNEKGNDWLFDYIFNSGEDGEKMEFQEYLEQFDVDFKSLFENKGKQQ